MREQSHPAGPQICHAKSSHPEADWPAKPSLSPSLANSQAPEHQWLYLEASVFGSHLFFRNIVSKLINTLWKRWWCLEGGRACGWRCPTPSAVFPWFSKPLWRQLEGWPGQRWADFFDSVKLISCLLDQKLLFKIKSELHTVWGVGGLLILVQKSSKPYN